jgi:23S rRNA pseudouridine1911/1915/1917 synthase
MTKAEEIVVAAAHEGERLDRFLRQLGLAPSRAALEELLARGAVVVNGRPAKKGLLLRAGDRVTFERDALMSGASDASAMRPAADASLGLTVVYEDAWLVVVDKPAGVPSHALRAGERGTITSALLARYPEMSGVGHRPLEPGIVHRLDTETSGLLIAARDKKTFDLLKELHGRSELDKRYLALCHGSVSAPQRIESYLRADQRRVRVEREPFERARAIHTEVVLSERRAALSLVELRVAFAARHQIRAQLAALGHPLASDSLYGGATLPGLSRHFLHASALRFRHPITGEELHLSAALPADLHAVLAALPTPER